MAKDTPIQWAHSSANWQMGCDGCELWNQARKICYAGRQTEKRAGLAGWPESFDKPKLFLDRVEPTLKWGPPTEKERESKPWIPSDYPRVIFLNDMGDTFSKSLAENWLAPFLPRIAVSPHQFLVLTKRPSALRRFAERFPLPKNVWPGTTFTSAPTIARIRELVKIQSGGPKFVSFEPLWSMIPSDAFEGIAWAIFGGESGATEERPTEFPLEWLEQAMLDATTHLCRRFVKQLGSNPTRRGQPFRLKDFHGGQWEEWPDTLRVREMPILERQPDLL